MAVAERREREKEERRSAILDAAERVFLTKSVRDATMDEIAAAAELSKGTLYLYFDSKDELSLVQAIRDPGHLVGLDLLPESGPRSAK